MKIHVQGSSVVFVGFTVLALCDTPRFHGADQARDTAWDMLSAKPEVVAQWQDIRFGMFLCWGPVTLTGQEIGWSRGAPRGHGFLLREGQGPTPGDVYDNLYKRWKPDKFDARQWVRIAQEAGQKYMTIPRHNPIKAFTLGGIVRDAGLTAEEFRRLL